MSHQSTHHHVLLNSIPPTHHHHHHHHHQPNPTAPIKPENDSDDEDVLFLSSVPKIQHTPEDYDPECQCSTCQLVRRLLAECTCEECRSSGQPDQSSENVPIANAVSPTNGQPSSSSIQNNDAATGEHTNANDQNDDRESRSSTPDYLPRFFDDESGDSSSDDSEHDSGDDDVHDVNYENHNMASESLNSIVGSLPSTCYQKATVTNEDTSDSSDNESTNLDDERTDSCPVKCPKCVMIFTERHKILRHYRRVHQEWKPFYCRWPKCNFVATEGDKVVQHTFRKHFNSKNRQKAIKFVAKREETQPNDPVLEQIVAIKFVREKKKRTSSTAKSGCPRCGRNLHPDQLKRHIGTHANVGYRCTWPNCGFFYSHLKIAKKHICTDHLQVEQANSKQTNRYLVKANPKTGETTKVIIRQKMQNEVTNNDNVWVEEDSNSDVDNESYAISSCFNSNDNESANLDDKDADPATVKCPKCTKTFTVGRKLLRHYRGVHQEWKPYYCRWPKCNFASAIHDIVIGHADRTHFNLQNRQKARKYVGKREETQPNDPVLEKLVVKFGHQKKIICNFKGKLVNATLISEHLVEVDPNLPNSNGLNDTIQNNDASTSEHTNANDQDHDHSRSSKPDYLPRLFDDESGDSSSDDSEHGVERENDYNESDHSVYENDDKELGQESEHNDNGNDPLYAHSRPSTSKFLNKSIGPTLACPQCKQNMPSENHLKTHIRSHAKPGFRCTWPRCGFFYSGLNRAKKHVCVDHLQVDKINSKYINKHLIRVNPRTGKTAKVGCYLRKQRKEDNQDNSDDEEYSDSDDSGESSDKSN